MAATAWFEKNVYHDSFWKEREREKQHAARMRNKRAEDDRKAKKPVEAAE